MRGVKKIHCYWNYLDDCARMDDVVDRKIVVAQVKSRTESRFAQLSNVVLFKYILGEMGTELNTNQLSSIKMIIPRISVANSNS